MDKDTFDKFNTFFNKAPSVEDGIKKLITKSCDVDPGTSVEEILNGVRDVIDELDAYFTTDPCAVD